MCERMTEPPLPGSELFCYWHEEPIPIVDEQRDIEIGDWTIRVQILRVKDSTYAPDRKHVIMEVIG